MSRSTTERTKTKQPFRVVLKNNLFMTKLVFKASPSLIIFSAADAVRNQVSIFFEHTVLIGLVLEAAEYHYPFSRIATTILIFTACIVLGMIFTVYAGDYIDKVKRPLVREKVRMLLYEQARRLDLACYDNPEFYNEQVLALSEIDKQIDRVITFINNTLSGLATFLLTGAYFLSKDMFSIVFALASFVLSFVFSQLYNRLTYLTRIERNPNERKRSYVNRVFYLNDYAKEIRLNPGVSDVLMDQFREANEEVYKTEKKYAGRKFILGFLRDHVSNNMFSDVFYVSYLVFRAAVQNAFGFSTVAILYNSFGRLKRGMRIFTETYPYACETSLYVQKIRNFLEYEPKIRSTENLPVSVGAKDIDVRKISFAYKEDSDMLLQDISLHITPGEKIALVGYNGAGKTTLVKLLMRLYDVNHGEILADGTDIRKYNLAEYRRSIGTVFQDFQIFAGSVKENVLLDVAEGVDDKPILDALKESGLLDRVQKLSGGLQTPLTTEFSKDGVNLSGGESQKLAIARVFCQQAGLMILDEPSSALDPIAEYQLNHAMLSATKDKTVIFISHRLSTTRLADRIIMLENGRIVEQGTHDELLAKDGKYAQMWHVQAGAYITA